MKHAGISFQCLPLIVCPKRPGRSYPNTVAPRTYYSPIQQMVDSQHVTETSRNCTMRSNEHSWKSASHYFLPLPNFEPTTNQQRISLHTYTSLIYSSAAEPVSANGIPLYSILGRRRAVPPTSSGTGLGMIVGYALCKLSPKVDLQACSFARPTSRTSLPLSLVCVHHLPSAMCTLKEHSRSFIVT